MRPIIAVFFIVGTASAQCPASFSLTGPCNFAAVSEAADCDITSELGLNSSDIDGICADAVYKNTRNFTYVTFQGQNSNNFQWDNNYFDGGTRWNDAKETATEVLHSGDTGSILRTYNDYASDAIISWPDYGPYSYYTDNFKNCDARIAMCCFIDKRLETPLVPNADVCNHDLADSKHSNHINSGYSVFGDREEKAYCNAISWEDDESSISARYAGNALFYISMYSGLYENGYVENIAGSPLCACIEQMATVDDTDCTKVDAVETYSFSLNGTDLSATLSSEVSYSTCDEDFEAHYSSMASTEEVEDVTSNHIVEDCADANEMFLNEKFYVPGSPEVDVDTEVWEKVVGQGYMHYPPISETSLRELLTESPNDIIRRKCLWCYDSHKDIYYKRLTPLPPAENLDFLDLLMNNWFSTPKNELGVDFMLFSSYEDALNGVGNWTFCNYDDEAVGFPRDCGPNGKVDWNWNTYINDNWRTRHHAFYVEKSSTSTA